MGLMAVDMSRDEASGAALAASDILDVTSSDLPDTDELAVLGGADDSLEAGAGWAHGGVNADGWRVFTQDVGGTVATLPVVSVEPTGNYRLRLLFDDGFEGEPDIAAMVPFEGVFAPLRDPKAFGAVDGDPVLGTIVRPNGADLDPDVLYAIVTGKPVPDLIPATVCLDPHPDPPPQRGEGSSGRFGRPPP